ncbi:hypothetical protein [Prevotella falsenii]|nr:hypothetical protein [Prevotella falsenii]
MADGSKKGVRNMPLMCRLPFRPILDGSKKGVGNMTTHAPTP